MTCLIFVAVTFDIDAVSLKQIDFSTVQLNVQESWCVVHVLNFGCSRQA